MQRGTQDARLEEQNMQGRTNEHAETNGSSDNNDTFFHGKNRHPEKVSLRERLEHFTWYVSIIPETVAVQKDKH
jgi:hypothetical protein